MSSSQSNDASLSIGAVSRATDIPAATLRTWERRYGFPDPARNDAGHRRYTPEDIDRLRLIARAVDRDHRPSDVVPMQMGRLRALLETSDADESSTAPDEATEETDSATTTVRPGSRPSTPNAPPKSPPPPRIGPTRPTIPTGWSTGARRSSVSTVRPSSRPWSRGGIAWAASSSWRADSRRF
ncbi:MAG: MerR family transcriptional regulator [Bradymonadaceae bacterium]